MNIDGFILKALTTELNTKLVGQRIDKIHQPNASTVTLHIGKQRLIIDASSAGSHMLLSTERMQNPLTPPFFCLMLRKHLTNSRIESVSMEGFERVARFALSSKDELGNPTTLCLMVELTGKHSNVILVNEKGTIVDAIRRVPLASAATRPVFPGVSYEMPPSQTKTCPLSVEGPVLASLAKESTTDTLSFMTSNIQGLSQLLAREVVYRFSLPPTAQEVCPEIWDATAHFINKLATLSLNDTTPIGYSAIRAGKVYFHILELTHMGENTALDSINDTLQFVAMYSDTVQRLEVKRSKLIRATQNNLKKLERLLQALKQDLRGAQNKDQDRYYGELLYANIGAHRIDGDMAIVTDYYSPDLAEVAVPVNPKTSLTDNARVYFKRYHKAVGAIDNATRRLEEATSRQEYLQSIIYNIQQAEELEVLEQIEQEMTSEGVIASSITPKGKPVAAPRNAGPALFVSPDGLRVAVGKNNLQNDQLVRQAKPADLWFHVQKAPGSHCLISAEGTVPESTLLFAANLAAWYSSMRGSSSVPIDYTERRNVKRPSGAKPGLVIYDNHKTILVKQPQEPGGDGEM